METVVQQSEVEFVPTYASGDLLAGTVYVAHAPFEVTAYKSSFKAGKAKQTKITVLSIATITRDGTSIDGQALANGTRVADWEWHDKHKRFSIRLDGRKAPQLIKSFFLVAIEDIVRLLAEAQDRAVAEAARAIEEAKLIEAEAASYQLSELSEPDQVWLAYGVSCRTLTVRTDRTADEAVAHAQRVTKLKATKVASIDGGYSIVFSNVV